MLDLPRKYFAAHRSFSHYVTISRNTDSRPDSNELSFSLYDMEVKIPAKLVESTDNGILFKTVSESPICRYCKKGLWSKDSKHFGIFDIVRYGADEPYFAYVHGLCKRYECPNKDCIGKTKTFYSPNFPYENESKKASASFRSFLTKLCASHYKIDIKQLAKELSTNNFSISDDTIHAYLADECQHLGHLRHCTPHCRAVYIFPVPFKEQIYNVVLGLVDPVCHGQVFKAFISDSLKTQMSAYAQEYYSARKDYQTIKASLFTGNLAIIDIFPDDALNHELLRNYIIKDWAIKEVYVPGNNTPLYDLLKTEINAIKDKEGRTRYYSCVSHKNDALIIKRYKPVEIDKYLPPPQAALAMSIKFMIKELSRRMDYPELRACLFMQSEYRSVSINDCATMLEDLTCGFPSYSNNKSDPDVVLAPSPYFAEYISTEKGAPIDLEMLSLSMMMNNLSYCSLPQRDYLCRLLYEHQASGAECMFRAVPHLNDIICPTDNCCENALPVAFVTSFVSAAAVVADWQSRTMFPVAFEEDAF